MGFDKCIVSCTYNYSMIQNTFTTLKKPSYQPCILLNLRLPLFTVSKVLPFQKRHVVCIMQYVAFSDWLFSFSLSFLCVFPWMNSSFFYGLTIFLCMNITLFIRLPVKGHLGCCHFRVIMNKIAININRRVFVWT